MNGSVGHRFSKWQIISRHVADVHWRQKHRKSRFHVIRYIIISWENVDGLIFQQKKKLGRESNNMHDALTWPKLWFRTYGRCSTGSCMFYNLATWYSFPPPALICCILAFLFAALRSNFWRKKTLQEAFCKPNTDQYVNPKSGNLCELTTNSAGEANGNSFINLPCFENYQ